MNSYGVTIDAVERLEHPKGLTWHQVTYVDEYGTKQKRRTVPGSLQIPEVPTGKVDVILNGRKQVILIRKSEEEEAAPAQPSAQTSVPFNPISVVSAHGAHGSFHQLGELKWSGTVFRSDDTPVFVEELAQSWRATLDDGSVVTMKTLDRLLTEVL